MVAILPDEVLDIKIYPPPPTTVIHGLDGTNKLDLIASVLAARRLPHAIVKCRECLSQRHLLSKIFTSCARALDRAEAIESYERVENINGLLVNLERLCRSVDKRHVVLVLDAVDELRGAGGTLLAALARLGDLIPTLSLILTTTSPRPLPLHRSGVPYIHFPPYTRSEAVIIVTTSIPDDKLIPPRLAPNLNIAQPIKDSLHKIYTQFAITVYDALIAPTSTHSLAVFRQCLEKLWPRFIWPALDGEVLPVNSRNKKGKDTKWDFARLLVRNRGLLSGKAVEQVLLDTLERDRSEGWSFDDLQRESSQKRQQKERQSQAQEALQLLSDPNVAATDVAALPAGSVASLAQKHLLTPLIALLLLATHLASTTPSKHDILLFSRLSNTSAKHRKIRYIKRGNPGSTPKKANEDGRRKDKTKRAGPRAVGLERVLALARAVSGEVLTEKGHKGWSDAAMGAMGELERMRLVRRDDAPRQWAVEEMGQEKVVW
ncbi:uncharacterized protein AB675_5635 [Cyphellophora attinorum]|uniref:Origin recognition complex subunit 5 n=1 Tax=Cyphellophora attinorum TaxID=1664694 RepID=A0A0N0NP13_9EURO|nr:uncharacterized protein AB675_5635 [Phialophora attinorum]KPI42019.1 hypothetical protein AB675_5635 [Phialophora attinorum]